MKDFKLIVSGYSSFDHIIKLKKPATLGETSLIKNSSCRQIYWGGCSINVVVALSRLGITSLPVLRTGDDFKRSGFKQFLEDEKIPQEAIIHVPDEISPTSFLLQAPDGEHITTFYPGAMNEEYYVPYKDKWFEHSENALMTVASLKDNKEFLKKVKKYNLSLFFGMKGDFSAFPKDFLREVLKESKIIFMNLAEKKQIELMFNLNDITDLFEYSNANVVVTTLGKEGARYYSSDGNSETISSINAKKVVDTTGGGDAFISGFLYGYFQGEDYSECCRLGNYLSVFVLEAEGCCTNLPEEKMLKDRMNDSESILCE